MIAGVRMGNFRLFVCVRRTNKEFTGILILTDGVSDGRF